MSWRPALPTLEPYAGVGRPPAPSPRLRPWVQVALWAAVSVAVLLALSFLLLVAALSGGVDDLLDRPGPFASDPEVVEALEAAHARSGPELDALLAEQVGPSLSTGSAVRLAGARSQSCVEGQHDWKRDDPYDLSCAVSGSVVVAGDSGSFRADTVALHAALLRAGWTSDGQGLDDVLADYWDQRAVPGAVADPQDYSPADLPSARYDAPDRSRTLHVGWTDVGERSVDLPGFTGEPVWTTAPPGAPPVPADLLGDGSRYGLVLELERTGFVQ